MSRGAMQNGSAATNPSTVGSYGEHRRDNVASDQGYPTASLGEGVGEAVPEIQLRAMPGPLP